nr:alpha/beta hydrolase [Cohnella lubricantis]
MRTEEGIFHGAGGYELFYRAILPNTAPKAAVIALHGLGDHSGGMANMTQRLAEQGYAVYAFDLRGHGRNPGTRAYIRKWEEYTDDLHLFRQKVELEQPNSPLYLIGHSLGGAISIDYALRRSAGLAGLAAIAPALTYEMKLPEKVLVAVLSIVKPDFTVNSKPDFTALTKDPEARARLASDELRHYSVTPGLGRGLANAIKRIESSAHTLSLPFLLQYGLADPVTPPGKLRLFFDSIPSGDKRRIEYPDMLHRPYDDLERERFLADLTGWLDRKNAEAAPG